MSFDTLIQFVIMLTLVSVKGLGRNYAWRERFGAADGGTGPC